MKLNIIYISKNADQLWKKLRWENLVPTCKCGCTETYSTGDNRYKCKKCGYNSLIPLIRFYRIVNWVKINGYVQSFYYVHRNLLVYVN